MIDGRGARPVMATMFTPRLSNTRPAPPMDEMKKPSQHGECPVKTSRFVPGKMDPARRPVPMFRLPCFHVRWRPRSTGPKNVPRGYRLMR